MSQVRQNIVGQRVKQARLRSIPVITQQELSNRLYRLGVSIDRSGVAKIEAGLRGVLDFEVIALAKVLRVTSSWLLGETK